ncbi:MAG: hypothetical protein CMI18_13550 [Opitutaceae bacterium]|nr:hypothetical protein [Opitutaceae bacterium]
MDLGSCRTFIGAFWESSSLFLVDAALTNLPKSMQAKPVPKNPLKNFGRERLGLASPMKVGKSRLKGGYKF